MEVEDHREGDFKVVGTDSQPGQSLKRTVTSDRGEESTKRRKNSSSSNDDSLEEQKPRETESICSTQWLQFNKNLEFEEISIDDRSTLQWCSQFLSGEAATALFEHLMKELNFEHSTIKMYGKVVHVPRLQSWFAEEGLVVRELFQKQKQHVWTTPMKIVKAKLEQLLKMEFDYCLVNLYRDGDDSINFHADNETRDVVASLSLGATRRFLVRHQSCFGKTLTRSKKPLTNPMKKEYEFSLSNGSLIVMAGDTQLYWKHSVPKEKNIRAPRINLTFRTIKKN